MIQKLIRTDETIQALLHDKLKLPYLLHVSIRQWTRRPKATVIFLHGIGNNGEAWRHVTNKLPSDVRILSIDLLGHGKSPKPQNMTYNVQVQARAVIATLLHQRSLGRVILVGHSMGALVSIEVAKRYPRLVKSLVLCSPPLYGNGEDTDLPRRERQLKKFYAYLRDNPEVVAKIARHVKKFNISNGTFTIDEHTLRPFLGALQGSILTQTALSDAKQLKCPFVIIHGRYDPLVLKSYHHQVVKENENGTFKQIAAHHDVKGKRYIQTVVHEIEKQIGH